MPIITDSREILDGIHLVDFHEWGGPFLASGVIMINPSTTSALLIDTGSSKNVGSVLKAIKAHGLQLKDIVGMIPSHYHFDHAGGSARLLELIKPQNPDFKILARKETKNWLQHPEAHVRGAKTTYGDSVGEMPYIPDEDFKILKPDKAIDIQGLFGRNFDFQHEVNLVSTPGHTPDHSSVYFRSKGIPGASFLFSGEAAGTLFHKDKLVSLPTSMPSKYRHDWYMDSLDKIMHLEFDAMAFGHFGAIRGKEDIAAYLKEHRNFNERFRNEVQSLYKETRSTRAVVEKFIGVWEKRTNTLIKNRTIMENMCVGLVYGMLIDLGLKEAKYEPREA